MREIKFRAWHKDKKVYIDIYTIAFHESIIKGFIQHEYIEVSFDEIILEQFTGLKDKNGVEIYEGDIVEYDRYSCQVVYCEKTASFRMNKITYPENTDYENAYVFTIFNTPYNIKVINQIHEKGDLVE